jgi:hypothetical protein
MGWQGTGLVVGVMAGHLHLQLRHCASAIVADSNISYCQMLLSRDTVRSCGLCSHESHSHTRTGRVCRLRACGLYSHEGHSHTRTVSRAVMRI